MRTLLLLLFSLLVFIPQNIAKDKDKENKTTKTPSKEPLQYVGCFKDNDPRDLPQRVFHNEDTVASCVKACKNMKYRFAGIQFAYLCFCGNLHGRFGQLPNGRCDSECRKKNDTQCGGKWANSIFRTGYEPLAHKHANKHTKRDNVVMFDNPMQYQNADDRTFTIDVAANKHSDVPGSGIRTQRSYGSTGPNDQYNQYYANQYDNKNYNSYNTANNNNQYAATTKSNVQSNYTTNSYNNGYPQQTNTDQQNSAPPESSSSQYPSQSASNATSPVYGGAEHPQSNSYETPNVYSNGQYGTKATSNSPSMASTQADNAANYGEHHFNAVPENNSQQHNGYVISVTMHEDNTTAGADTPSTQQSDANNQHYPTNAGYPNAAQSVQQNNNIESVAQASAADNAGSSQAQAYAASSSYSSQPAAAPSSAAQDTIQGVQQNNNIESVAQASAVDNSQAQSYAASSSYSSQPAGSTQTQTNNYGSQATPSAPEQIVSSVASASAENTQTAAQPQDATVQEVVSQASTSSSSPTTNYDQSNTAPSSEPKTPCTIERKMAQHMEDTFKPVCTENGDYGEVQCFEHKGYGKQCWCVDENGHEKKGTRAYGDQKPACSNQDKAESQCERERKIASSTLIPDIYVPVCDSQGNFVAVQCFDHRTYGKQCWCVDGSGQEIKGTRTHKGAEPSCDNTHPVAVQPMTCKQAPYGCCSDGISAAKGPNMEGCLKTQQTERKVSKCKQEQDQATSGAVDIFIPDCKSNGQYNEVQCYSFPVSGKTQCWCVNSDTGVEQPGTRLDEQQPNCQQAATTTKPLTTAARPPALVVCMVTVHKCCPDGVTAAKGPNYEGCPGPTTPAHVPSITSPTVPLGSANEVCVTVRFMQVWYPQLTNRFGMYYLQLEKTLEKSLRDIYRVHPDFLHVHFSEARPETNPLHPTGPKALAVFFVLFFRRLVADPLATIRDSIDEDHKLAGRVVFPMTLRNLGIPYKHLGCPQEHYKPINPVISKTHPAPSGTIATSKPVVTTAAPITTPSPPSTANPCGQCLTTATCPTHCPPPVSTKPPAPPTTSPNTPPPTKSPNTPPPTTAPPLTLPQVTTPSAGVPTCGPCITPPNCPPACPVTHPTALPQTTAPPPLPPQTTAPPILPPQTTAPPILPPQTTGSPPLPPQTTTPPPLPPQTTPPQLPCAPSPCPTLPCPPPCPVTPPQTTLPPTTATTPTPSTPTTPTTPKETTPTTKAPETTPTTKPTKPQGPPVDGGYTPWTEWTECSVTCDGGVQQRTRTCTSPEPKDGGKDCKALGESFETKGCNTRPCPVDGGYSNWSPFEECSATCGGGHQVRSRKCDKPEPMYGGQNCSRLGAAKETRPCNTFYCPIHGNFSDWSDYMTCSVTCGGGSQYNMRTCTNPPPQHGGNDCSALGPSRISRACNTQDCPVDGGYSPFSKFSDCTATCGGGNQIRTRTCVNPPPRHGGEDCSKDGPDFETRECNTQLCPVDGAFTTFSDYSTCSKTCGGGNQARVRSCTNPEPQFGGKNCTGTWKETKSCNTQPCPVDGGFGEWGNYSECEVSCGGGTQMRMRTCTNPAPGNGGKTCKGKTTETKDCNMQPCPVNGGYNDWSSYGPCSSSCGGGSQQRTRECTNPPPSQGGRSCGLIGPSHETRNCSTNPCPIHGEYTKWTKWSDCSKPCGGGVIKRTRNCTNPPPEFGGKDCSALGPEQETQYCNLMQCPIDGNYSSWAEWSSCTVTCGSGEHMRSRTCTNPPPEFGGKDCTPLGKSTESTTCNTQSCPIHGGYSPWSDWSKCSVICGEGHQYRSRKCSSPTPEFGGADCSDLGSPTDTKACVLEPCPTEPPNIDPEKGWNLCSKSCGGGVQWRNIELDDGKTKNETRTCASDPCPIDGGYSPWSNWTQCSVSCGGGVTSRSRTCTEPIPMFGGQRCEAPEGPVQTKHCSMQSCPPPKIPIRSCREFYERCHKRSDGLYSIYVNEKITASEMTVYCDMTQSQGGWTLILTTATNQGWNDATVKGRNEDEPSLVQDYSILDKANAIKSNSLGPFLYRLEAHERGNYGGIWSAPQSYSFISSFANQTGVTEVEKFDPTWNYGPTTLGLRMPWLPPDDEYALLTTSDRLGKEWFGTLVAMKPLFKPAPWMLDTNMNNPRLIWYWLKEAPSLLKPPSDIEADPMCPSPVPGGYGQWGAWSSCPRSCGGGMQIRTRNCTSPEPLNGGEDCSEVGPNVETKECNPLPCPGATVNGGYTPWSEWTECTATCGGGSQMRTRKCADPTPQNGGKSCIDQGLGNEIETRKCNLQSCPSPCSPPCKNGGQCIDNHCKCPPGLYEGTYCQTAICKKPCQNGGTCVDPLENLCICQPQWGGDTCDKPICTKYCKNGGTCTALNTCTCQPGYSGSRCEKSICAKECVNGGRCVNSVCQCLSGYSGLACEIVDRCSLPTPIGPCFAALQDIVKKTTPKEFETPCMTYLREVYQTCSSKSTPEMTVDLCDQQCEHRPGVCSKVWATESCPSWEDKYYYDTATAQCKGIRFNGCLGNHNLFSRMESCTKGCASGGNFGPPPTVVTPTVPSKHPPVPTSYYWYFLTVSNNQVSGSPPLDIKGSYRFIDLGYFFNSKDSWVETQLTNEDGLLDPDKLTAGLSIGLKIKLDGSMRYCQEPRYLVDTGSSSLQTRGLSIFVVGRTLSVQITTSKNIYKVYTNVVFGLWKYLMITWKPSAGINVYFDGEKAASSDEPLSANNPPINVQAPNFAVGRKLGPVGGTCGKFYLSSLAVFKQFVDNVMVRRIYQFFWFNIVSQSPPPTFYIRLSVTNKAGQAIIIRSGDDMPAEGFKISANVIAVITKTVPGNIATTFTAYGTDGQRLQMNQKALIELNPSPTKEYSIPILIGKPAVVMRYHLYMQITNMAKRDIRILRRVAIDETPKEFTVKSNAIANVDLKLNSSDPVTVSVVDNEYKPLFINFKPSLVLTPTEVIGIAIPLTITASSSPTLNFVIKLSLANYVGSDVIIKSSDGDPKEGLHAKSGKKTLVTKKVGSPNSFTLNAVNKATGVAVAINNAASLVVTPWAIDAKDKDFVVINITKGIVKPKPQSNVYSIYLVVSNNLGRNVILIPSDNKPFDGFEIPVRTIVIISKICNDTKPVDFIAVDPATETMVLVNGTERQKVTPNNDGRPVSLQITAPEGSAENPVVPSVRPAYYWSFYTLNNGTVLGSPPFSARGNVQIDNDGIFLDGISAYLGSHMNSDDALVYPERFSKGISFGIKVKFPDSVLEYTVPKYLIDSGAKSLSSRGVSLYLLEKRLVAELATSDKTWKTEADISGSTNRWLYVMVSWSQERGLTLYVDGVERGGDSGGLDTSGKEAAPQEENLRIGRNIGAEQANFASFFLSSFAIFRQDVPAPMAFQVYKYYITKAIIQPSKMYYISLYVNNTMDKEVELVSNDGHPPGGVHLQPKQILVIRKEIAASTFVVFTAEDVNTGGDLLINDEGEYVATPSEYKQQLTTLTITDAGSIGKPAPRDRYYATLILKNKCKTNAVIISNDNHPSDGYRIAPGSQETLTKEVLTPGDIVVRAFDPSTSRTLLINGEESYVVTPTREKANPDGLEITSSGEDDSPSSSPPIPYSHYWSLNSINKGFVEGNPAFKVNGEVLVKDGGITFDGESAWLGASVDREGCLLNPGNCIEGFSIGTKLKFDGVPDNDDDRYIIDTGAQSTARRGVSLFIAKNGKLSFVLATAERTWMTSTPVIPNRWFYLIVMWSRNDGLSMYIDNQLKSSVRNGRPNAEEKLPTIEQTNLNIGRNINGQSGAYNANFEMASLVVFNRNIPTQSITPVTSYFSKPLPVQPLTKYYIMLNVTNRATSNIILEPSDKYPGGGFTISHKSIATIKKEVSKPSAVSFVARIEGQSNKFILLNGKPRISVTPSETPLDMFEVNVSPEGETVDGPIEGEPEEDGVKAPPVHPDQSWLLADLDGGIVPGNPALAASGNVARIDGGLEFDGVTAYLSGMLAPNQCLLDLDGCSEGFSFGIKMKFKTSSLTVNSPRYVVDSGRTAKARGIAVYLVMKELFVEIATSTTLYKGAVTVQGDRWFFLMATWSRKTGMTLYMDGLPIAMVPEGITSMGYPVSTTSPNFAIGRSATSNSYFADVSISSFSTFHLLLSPNNVKALSNFFWIRGSEGEGKTFYVVLKVVNPLPITAVVLSDDGLPNEGIRIPPNGVATIVKTVKSSGSIAFSATNRAGNGSYYLNNRDIIRVLATRSKDVVTRAVLATTGVDTPSLVDASKIKFFRAPPVFARHSWSFNTISIKAKKVPGTPPLSAYGVFAKGNGGLMFDGKTNWLGGHLESPDCATDPDQCYSGFSLATKLYLDESVSSYIEPKYLIDTGASSTKSRGISIYVMGGSLYCELASANKVWMITQNVDAGVWMFVGITWSPANGLILYINGARVGADAAGRVASGRTINFSGENLVIGRDVTKGGTHYCKFIMASLLTIESFFSPAIMRAVYSFYWRHGGTTSKGFVALRLRNQAGVDALITTSDNIPAQGLSLPHLYPVILEKQIATGSAISLAAKESVAKTPLLLNNQQSVSVSDSVRGYQIIVTKPKNTVKFYFSIKIMNPTAQNIVLKSSDNDPKEGYPVKSKTAKMITKSVASNLPITFTAVDSVTGKPVKLSGEEKKTITPTAKKGEKMETFTVQGAPQAQFFVKVKIINRSGKNVQLQLPLPGQAPVNVKKNVAMVITKGTSSNAPITITATDEDKRPIAVNGKKNIVLTPSKTKQEVAITLSPNTVNGKKKGVIPDHVQSVYYVTLRAKNKIRSKVFVATSVKDSAHGFHFGSSSDMQITKEYISDHPVKLQAFDPKTRNPLLMNGKQVLLVRPGAFSDPATRIEITRPVGNVVTPVTEHFITLMLNNKLHRQVRLIPSKGKKGGYIVGPASSLKVHLIIKGGPAMPNPISFKAEDVQTESTLEINEKVTPLSVTPAEMSDVMTYFNITAPAPSVKPQHSWSMASLKGSHIFGSPSMHAHGFYRYVDDGLSFDGSDTYMTTVLPKHDVLVNPDNSDKGFTIAAKIRFGKEAMEYQDEPRFILDSGGHHKGKRGVSLYIDSGKIFAEVQSLDRIWTVSKPLLPDVWMYLTVTWNKKDGLKMYRESVLRADDDMGRSTGNSTVIDLEENLTLGRNIGNDGNLRYAKFDLSSLTTFGEALNQTDIDKAFIFFSCGASAKIFYAPIRITNDVGRDIIIKPSKGNDKGFHMVPRSTLEVTLMSMSTDGNTPNPVLFTAIDANTKIELEVNNSPRPFPVTPTESMEDFTTMVVAVPQPSVTPTFAWSLQKVRHGKVLGAMPTINAFGELKEHDGGLQLDGKDSWLDAGDFKGRCLSDPQRCPSGFTIGLKIKLDGESSKYVHEPHYIIDTGGSSSNGRGLSLYVKNRKIYATVTQSNSAWRVEAPYTLNKWEYVLITWRADSDLSLYLDGTPVAASEAVIAQQGEHLEDSITHLAVGRNAAGPPYGSTKMAISSLVFFEHHVRPLDAQKISMYYWSSVSHSSSDRFIKVRFDNRAGVPIRVIPSKGDSKKQGYTIQPHMNLQLSYVEKGPFNNIPVTFLAENAVTNERLYINGRLGNLRVLPSPTKTDVTEAIVASSYKCPILSGFFADPTSNARYIHCTDRAPTVMTCPDQMTWRSDIKSCAGEGRESSNLYYYNVRFNNYAGSEAEIIKTTGHKQRNLLPSGKALHVKFTTTKKHASVFRAIYADTGDTLRLNDFPMLQVYPSDNPNKVTEVTVSKPAFFYTIETKTGSEVDADTQANVFIKLIGEDGETPEMALAHKGVTHFKLGGLDKFRVEATDIGKIKEVSIKHDDSGESPNWYLEKINIRDKNGRPYEFKVNSWLDSKQGDHVTVKQLVSTNRLLGHDQCTPSCINNGSCIDGKCQCSSGYEGEHCQHAVCDIPCLNGGTCISPDSNKCACPDGYTGKYCDKPVCADYCRNGGTCSGPNKCTCPKGYVGLRCETSRCLPDCMNGGQCVDGLCECPLGHSGKYCEQVSVCDLPSDPGPCFHEIFKAATKANKQNRTSACIRYLDDVLQSCTANNGSFNMHQCSKICEPEGEENVCKKIWEPGQCTSLLTKYTFDKESGLCQPMIYNGCLGNRNSFDSTQECTSACSAGRKRRAIRNSTQEQKPKLLKNLLHKSFHHIKRHVSYK